MELRVVTVGLHMVAVVALVGATLMDGSGRVAAALLAVVAGGAAVQLLWRHDQGVPRM